MHLTKYNKHLNFEKAQNLLEFDKILELTARHVVSETGSQALRKLLHTRLDPEPEDQLTLVEEILSFREHHSYTLSTFEPIHSETDLLKVQHSVLNEEAFIRLSVVAGNVSLLRKVLKLDVLRDKGRLTQFLNQFPDLDFALKSIQSIMDDEGRVRDQASPELLEIRNSIKRIQKSIYSTFKRELEVQREKGYLAEGAESIRNGRFVLRVLVEHKRKVPGIIVGESDTGRTIFIEPQICLEQNNELVEWELSERREIQKILSVLTSEIRPFAEGFSTAHKLLVDWDVLLAKSAFSKQIHGIKPDIRSTNDLHLIRAFHPLLLLKFNKAGKVPVPLSFSLSESQRILVISGPNAGGKTVVLKTVGLLQLMLQKGFLVPVSKGSKFPVFDSFWVDIGDAQSIDDGLSTYSAKLGYLKHLTDHVTDRSLVLLDEFGSGTEPIIGGAIAESILNEIAKSGAKAILTTHYSNLKTYTNHTPGMVNGAMLYDEAHMEPRYELQVGKPGSSYALDIAKKLRFPRQVIQYARSRAGKGLVRMEDLIAKLEEEKSTLEEKNKEYLKKLDALNRLIKAYQDTQDQFTLKKMKFKLEQKQFEYEKTLKTKEQHNALSREIREKLDIVQARKLESESQQKANYLAQEMQQLQKNYTDLVRKDLVIRPVRVGDKVRLIQHNLTGIVSEIQDEEAKVITENFTIKVKKSDLIPLQESMIVPKEKKVQLQLLEKTAAFTSTLDVRGLLPMDAVESLENYLDQALLTNVKEIKIIHGKGTGALRLAIQKVLKKNKYVGQISHPEEQEGGSGITLVQFK